MAHPYYKKRTSNVPKFPAVQFIEAADGDELVTKLKEKGIISGRHPRYYQKDEDGYRYYFEAFMAPNGWNLHFVKAIALDNELN